MLEIAIYQIEKERMGFSSYPYFAIGSSIPLELIDLLKKCFEEKRKRIEERFLNRVESEDSDSEEENEECCYYEYLEQHRIHVSYNGCMILHSSTRIPFGDYRGRDSSSNYICIDRLQHEALTDIKQEWKDEVEATLHKVCRLVGYTKPIEIDLRYFICSVSNC